MSDSFAEVMRVLVAILILGNILALIAGMWLLLAPQRIAQRLGLRSAHPLSVRRLTKPLERPHDSEKVMLRYPRLLGAALIAGGAFVLIKGAFFVSALRVAEGGRTLRQLFPGTAWPAFAWESVWITLLLLVLLGALLALLVGGLALIQVKTLKSFSILANRWISTRQAAKPASRPYYGIDRLVAEHPQVWGGVITLLSIYTLVMIVWFSRTLMH